MWKYYLALSACQSIWLFTARSTLVSPVHLHVKGKYGNVIKLILLRLFMSLTKYIGRISFTINPLIKWRRFLRNGFLELMSGNILNKVIICNDKDGTWVTNEVKIAIKRNNRVHRKWALSGRISNQRTYVRTVQNETTKIIKSAKRNYFSHFGEKLSSYDTGSKLFWTTFKRMVNKKKLPTYPLALRAIVLFRISNKKLIFLIINNLRDIDRLKTKESIVTSAVNT